MGTGGTEEQMNTRCRGTLEQEALRNGRHRGVAVGTEEH